MGVALRVAAGIYLWVIIFGLQAAAAADNPATVDIHSPDGNVRFHLDVDAEGVPRYRIDFGDAEVIGESRLGLKFERLPSLVDGFHVDSIERNSVDSTWAQPWGERRRVRDRHNELLVGLERRADGSRFAVRIRVFDDGVGFRYELPELRGKPDVTIVDELTEFRVPGDAGAWWIPGRGWNRYEFLYRDMTVADLTVAHTPLTLRRRDGIHLTIHEAALRDYAGFALEHRPGGLLKTDLAPRADGARVRIGTPFVTPWRTVQVSDDAVGLLNSDLILNLNEPNVLGDVSWVEPGKYVGIWWAMHIGIATWGSGDRHGATTAEAKRYIDFAAAHGFSGVLVEGWNTGWDGNWIDNGAIFSFTESHPDFDLEAVSAYARDNGVRLVGHHETSGHVSNYEAQMAEAFDLYESVGVRQVKTGYVSYLNGLVFVDESGERRNEWHDSQPAVRHFEKVLKEAAQRKISINTHEPVKATGLRRTYPNWISREGARGQEYNADWSPPNPPSHNVTLPYTRLMGGPLDFTPGIFDLRHQGVNSIYRVQSTLAHQLALYVTMYSPVQMAADLPENYEARLDAFQFIVDVPTDWEQSIALAGEVGDYVVYARQERGGDDWYLGAVGGETPRRVSVALDFLDGYDAYVATIYRDGADADWDSNPYDYVIEQRIFDREDTLELSLAAGGGTAIRFEPQQSKGTQ